MFYVLDIATGDSSSPGMIKSGATIPRSIAEFENYVILVLYSSGSNKNMMFINPMTSELIEEYQFPASLNPYHNFVSVNSREYMYVSSRIASPAQFYSFRVRPDDLDQIDDFQTSNFGIDNLQSRNTALGTPGEYVPQTVSTPTPMTYDGSLTLQAITPNPSSPAKYNMITELNLEYEYPVTLWNEDFTQIVRVNETVTLNFTWA